MVIEVPMPGREARLEILKIQSRPAQLGTDVDFATLADGTAGLTGADLAALCQRAKRLAIAEAMIRYPSRAFRHSRWTISTFTQRSLKPATRQETQFLYPVLWMAV